MARQEIQLELLLGKQVYALNGRAIGRLEEVRADVNQGIVSVNEFLVGSYAIFQRLAASEIGRTLLGLFGSWVKHGYRVRWDQIDFSEPERPRLNCKVNELLRLEEDEG
jgi:sporulation protein YlmC with PRC-barrel domain